ncbi:phage minor head protein [Arcobacter sp.]|uniref:phage head morphogenesis protein n=1 Tax=unclassified Arcobacter TaxID=2593671 RepID=UPI003B006663
MSDIIKLDFKKAPAKNIAYLQEKKKKISFDYKEIEKEAHHKAFTVAKIMQLDILSDVQGSIIQAQKEGKSFKKWKKELTPTLQKKGWWGEKDIINPTTGEVKKVYIGSRRLRTIFETNMRAAHAQGRANNIYSSTNEYIQYSAIMDSNTRPDHAAYNGIVKHRNDAFWNKNFPPNGWGCRCYVKSLSKKDLKRRGIKVDRIKYKDFSDKDFAYDTRFLSTESLENSYYNKAIKLAQNSSEKIPQNAISYIYSQDRIKSYQSFVDEVIKDVKYHKNIITTGAIDFEVFKFLKSKDIMPSTPHIYLSKKSLLHMTREAKQKNSTALSIEEIKNIPHSLKNPYMVIYDEEHKNILYVFNGEEKKNKIAVEVNYKHRAQEYNMIVTTGKVDIDTINGNIESGVYKVIKR